MGCGAANPNGLGLQVAFSKDRVHGTATLDRRHGGAPGFAHGGALAALMDDLFGYVLVALNRPGVTATITLDYRSPALLERLLNLTAWCERTDGRKLYMRGEIREGHTLVAEGRAMFFQVEPSHWERSGQPLPPTWKSWGQPPVFADRTEPE